MADFVINPLPYQYESLQSKDQFILWHGGRGSGKSHTLVQDLYNCCCWFPGGSFPLLCNDHVQLRDSTLETLFRYLHDIKCPFNYQKVEKILTFPNGSTVHGLTFEKDKTSLKGAEWDAAFIDEADGRNTTEEKFDYLVDSVRGKIGDRRVRVACNPVPPGHFLAKRFFIEQRKNHVGYKVSTYDNIDNLPPDYIENLEAKYPPGTDEHKRWMLGEMVTLQGAVYKSFDENNIVSPEDIPELHSYFYGQDLGVNDPHVLLEFGVDNTGCLYVTREYCKAGMDIVQHMPLMRPMYRHGWPIFSDHSATQHSIMKREGFNMVKAYKDVQDGIQMVSSRIIANTIRISTDCTRLIEDMYNYAWRDSSNAAEERPDHKFSHCPDALRYGVCGVDKTSIFA